MPTCRKNTTPYQALLDHAEAAEHKAKAASDRAAEAKADWEFAIAKTASAIAEAKEYRSAAEMLRSAYGTFASADQSHGGSELPPHAQRIV